MFYINGKLLTEESYPNQWKEVQEKIKEIQEQYKKRPITFKKRHKITINPYRGLKEPVQGMFIPFTETVMGKTGTETWTYTKSIPEIKDGKVILHGDDRRYHFLGESWIIDPAIEPELAYFMLTKSSFVKKAKIILQDIAKNAQLITTERQRTAELNRLIYHDTSEIHRVYTGDEFKTRQLAASWGIAMALEPDQLTYEEVQNLLYDRVLAGENEPEGLDKRGIDRFILEAQSPHITNTRAIIQRAFDKDIIYYEPMKNAILLCSNGDRFMEIPASEAHRYKEYLCRVLPGEEDKMRSLDLSVHDIPSIQPKQVDKMSMDELRELAQKFQLKTFSIKKDVLIEQIKEKLG